MALEIHHLHYQNVGEEAPADLAALCHECHKARHIDMNGSWWSDPEEMEDHWQGYWSEREKD